jgi:hypothetical protein
MHLTLGKVSHQVDQFETSSHLASTTESAIRSTFSLAFLITPNTNSG